jgi:hypothetical protein
VDQPGAEAQEEKDQRQFRQAKEGEAEGALNASEVIIRDKNAVWRDNRE